MGVEGFYQMWVNNHLSKKYRNVLSPPKGINSTLAVDMNGTLHKVAAKVYGYGGGRSKYEKDSTKARVEQIRRMKEDLKTLMGLNENDVALSEELNRVLHQEYVASLYEELDELMKLFDPKEFVIFAVDGVPPLAKIQQQRTRRYRGAAAGSPEFFNTNVIGVGTEWMIDITLKIEEWINQKSKGTGDFSTLKFVFSSHLLPGEGEHKIFNDFRNGVVDTFSGGNIVVTGKDADLNMLSLVSKKNKIFLYREKEGDYINIDALKSAILTEGRFSNSQPDHILLQDFVLITNFIGNDFLPSIFSFNDVKGSLNHIFATSYPVVGRCLTNDKKEIIKENFLLFLENVLNNEQYFLTQIFDSEYDYEYFLFKNAMTEYKIPGGVEYDFSNEKFRRTYYNRALLPRGCLTSDFEIDEKKMLPLPISTDEMIVRMVEDYLTGMQWVLWYYTTLTDIRQDFYYNHYYAPLLSDFLLPEVEFPTIESVILRKRPYVKGVKYEGYYRKNVSLNPLQQMMLTIPPKSFYLIPKKARDLLVFPGELTDISPYSFIEDKEGFNIGKEHKSLPILPPINAERMSAYFSGISLPKIYRPTELYIRVRPVNPSFEGSVKIQADRVFNRRGRGRGGGDRGRGNSLPRGRGRGGSHPLGGGGVLPVRTKSPTRRI